MFKITIEEIKTIEETEEGEYMVIDKRPYTAAEIGEQGNPEYYKDKLREIRGYAPNKTVSKKISIETFKQTVDELDLPAVIMAVNGLNK